MGKVYVNLIRFNDVKSKEKKISLTVIPQKYSNTCRIFLMVIKIPKLPSESEKHEEKIS